MKPRDIAEYVFLALTWGLSFLVLLKVVNAFGWVGAVTLRCLLAGAILLAVSALRGRRLDFSRGWRPFAVMGTTTVAVQLAGFSYATPHIGTAMVAIFVAAIPLFSMVIGKVWGHEKMTVQGVIGLSLGIFGMVLLVGFPAVSAASGFILGCIASLLSSFAAAFGSNYASRRLKGVDPLEVTIGSFLSGGLIMLPLLIAVPVPTVPQPVDYLYLTILGGGMSALTYVIYFRLVASIGATKAISVEFAVTIVAVLIGAIFLHERLSGVQVFGGISVICGCILMLGLLPRGLKVRPIAS